MHLLELLEALDLPPKVCFGVTRFFELHFMAFCGDLGPLSVTLDVILMTVGRVGVCVSIGPLVKHLPSPNGSQNAGQSCMLGIVGATPGPPAEVVIQTLRLR